MNDIDRSWSGFYKISGISMFISIILWLISLVLRFYQDQIYNIPIVDRLEILAKQQILFQLRNGIAIFAAIGAILGFLGIYLSLYKLKKNLILAGTVSSILGAVLAIGVRFGVHAEVSLAINYAKTTSENLQISYVAAAELIKSFSDSGIFLANLLLSVGGLIAGVAMLAGVFSKKVAYLVIISGSLGIIGYLGVIFNPMFVVIILLGAIPASIGAVLIGIRLIAVGKQVDRLSGDTILN